MVSFVEEDSHVAVNPLSISIPSSTRVSMDQFYGQPSSPEPSTCAIDGGVDSPPSYDTDALLQAPHLKRKFNIQPREDEGRETLPPYSSEISLENVFLKKMELEGAVHRAHDRNWYRVYVALQGTALTFHKHKSHGYFSGTWSSEGAKADLAVPEKKGHFMRSYNLQHADVGIAADYYKKKYVIRVRAETDQFLISCFKIETFVKWLQSLVAAIDIAPPLDTRSLPRDFSIPRARRRLETCSTSFTDVERNGALVREQYEIMRREYPRLVDSTRPEGVEGQASRPSTLRSQSEPNARRASSNDTAPTPSASSMLSRLQTQSSSALSQPPTLSTSPSLSRQLSSSTLLPISETESHPSIHPETGKWRPEHQWTAMYDMMYAKRCMAVLTSRSPRKSNFVIARGKQWVVDWATGTLTMEEPPDYGDVVTEGGGKGNIEGSPLRVGQHGDVVAAR